MENASNSSFDSNLDADAVLQTLTESVSGLIRSNIYRTLTEMPNTEDGFILKEDIDKLVDSCLGARTQQQQPLQQQHQHQQQQQQQHHQHEHQHQHQQHEHGFGKPFDGVGKGAFMPTSTDMDYKQMVNAHCQDGIDNDSSTTVSTDPFNAKLYSQFKLPLTGDHMSINPLIASLTSPEMNKNTLMSELERNKLLVENFNILETRLNQLECRISEMLQTVPHIREYQRKKFTINKQAIRDELQQLIERAEAHHPNTSEPEQPAIALTESEIAAKTLEEYMQSMSANTDDADDDDDTLSAFEEGSIDEFYYERRQNLLNRLYFKKSAGTMALHQRRQQTLPHNLSQLKYPGGRGVRDGRFPYFLELSERAKRVDLDEGNGHTK